MRTLIPTLLFFVLALHGYGQVERDKALHFLGGNLFGLAGAGIAKQASDGNRIWTFVGSVAGSALIGVAKEAVDSGQQENGWDNDDLAATVLGGVTVGITIDLFSKKDDNKRLRGNYSQRDEQKFNFNPKKNSEALVLETIPISLSSLGLSSGLSQN
ncbi:hypothetical protein J0X14_17005 [Muricauda sp. CAU 1633]|uniref:hypothetical protein n=1 Tax=Allomuricauda sp. CAU 1633 TaxID=2816036 RepID=UPI001A8F593B|nr:hypothetical protein [Muricauda sp. CAU 1633]MBO0324011.1 hypothetical protein [Muricauda sp. CAU 1633]